MTAIISSSLYQPDVTADAPKFDNGIILYRSLVTRDNIEATGEDENNPITNIANPATNLFWRGVGEVAHSITITIDEDHTDIVDGVGIAGANFARAGISFDIYARDNEDDDESWVQLAYPFMRADDGPIILRGPEQSWRQIRIDMSAGSEPPEISVVYVGKLMVLERRVGVGHTPIVDGRIVREATGRSIDGDFLGAIIFSERTQTSVRLENLNALWYRENMRPFVASRAPFFYAWSPITYPNEVGYVWFPGGSSPRPMYSRPNGMMAIDFEIEGVVR